jgi:hypothetical protein
LAMRKTDCDHLANHLSNLAESSAIAAASIMPSSPKKRASRLEGKDKHVENGRARQFRQLLAAEGGLPVAIVQLSTDLRVPPSRECSHPRAVFQPVQSRAVSHQSAQGLWSGTDRFQLDIPRR